MKSVTVFLFLIGLCSHLQAQTPDSIQIVQPLPLEMDLEHEVFVVVEEAPQYPGGEAALMKFLSDNVVYPQIARESNIQGTVYASFIIEPDGSLSGIKILRGIGGGCDEETIRVIKNMPNWIPGKQRGKPVRVQYNLPIRYILSDPAKRKKSKN